MKKTLKFIVKALLLLIIVFTIPNYNSFIYRFEKGQRFNGEHFYNPYQNLHGNWVKCNLHSHARAYAGMAKGKNSAEEMLFKYDSLKYDLACISNYNFIQDSISGYNYLPVYEHGFNRNWIHQLVVNEKEAKWFDFPFIQLRSNKQFIINRLKTDENLIVLNHSNFKSAYTKKDLMYLDNYDLIEGISEFSKSIVQWDYALSQGHAVWVVGNDDAHDLSDYHVGICWNMVDVDTLNREQVLNSLKRGASYATKGWMGQEMNVLKSISVEDGFYKIMLEHKADSIILLSDFGKEVASVANSDTLVYKIKAENSYVRAEVFESESWNTYTKMYFNPVIRSSNGSFTPHNNKNSISYMGTSIYCLLLFLLHALIGLLVWKW